MILQLVFFLPVVFADQLLYFENKVSDNDNPLCRTALSCQQVSLLLEKKNLKSISVMGREIEFGPPGR
jgi:hypothetical protein